MLLQLWLYFSKDNVQTKSGYEFITKTEVEEDIVQLVVGLHGEEVSEPGLLTQGEPDEVAPGLVAHKDEEGDGQGWAGQGWDPPLRGDRVEADHIGVGEVDEGYGA